ncbi:MAG: signal peptidase I [Eubacteriales bacterium]|nr:signal peptidase I [Eubacteriales bacterium]
MQGENKIYTSREEVEHLLQQTQEGDKSARDAKGKKKWSFGKIIRRSFYGLLILSLLLMLGKVWLDRANGRAPSLFGYQVYVVETGSMIPTLPVGSTILIRSLGTDEYPQVGDVITYTHIAAAVTHRVTEIIAGDDGVVRFQTKGDNPENSPDPWLVEREEIRGIMIWHFAW